MEHQALTSGNLKQLLYVLTHWVDDNDETTEEVERDQNLYNILHRASGYALENVVLCILTIDHITADGNRKVHQENNCKKTLKPSVWPHDIMFVIVNFY